MQRDGCAPCTRTTPPTSWEHVRGVAWRSFPAPRSAFGAATQQVEVSDATGWVCPMRSDYTADVLGTCPRCGMALVHAAPFDVRDYDLNFRTAPAVVRAGQRAPLRFQVEHPNTRGLCKNRETL